MPKKSRKSEGSDLVLSSYLVDCMVKKLPFRVADGEIREYQVHGPMQVNGEQFPFHLRFEEETSPGTRRIVRIAVEPFLKADGTPRRKISRKPVYAIMCCLSVTAETDGEIVTLEVRKVDWIPAAFPDPEA